jgi:hypothetical protein
MYSRRQTLSSANLFSILRRPDESFSLFQGKKPSAPKNDFKPNAREAIFLYHQWQRKNPGSEIKVRLENRDERAGASRRS